MTNLPNSLVILGAGYQALETSEFANEDNTRTICFSTPSEFENLAKAEPFISYEDIELSDKKTCQAVTAVALPKIKRDLIESWDGKNFATIISKCSYIASSAEIGEGVTIAPGAVISIDTKIGNHVTINLGSTISHGCIVGDYSTISPGVNIAGNVDIGVGSIVGIGATILQNIKIGKNVYVGAGSVVTTDIPDNSLAYGVPCKVYKKFAGEIIEL